MNFPILTSRAANGPRWARRLRPVACLGAALVVAALCHSRALEAADLPGPADLPSQSSLPDPLTMLDVRKVASREMCVKERRPELFRLFQHYM